MRLTALSGFGVKGPACFLLEIAGRRIMLDLGRGPDGDALPDLSGAGPVDAIVLSHGHVDHTGALHLASDLADPPIFATAPTIALSTQPQLRTARPLEGQKEILGVPFEMGPAGHAPGAVWIRIGGTNGLVYTGDLSDESLLWRCEMPFSARVAVVDASYGVQEVELSTQIESLLRLTDLPLLLPAPAGGRGLELAVATMRAGLPVAICPNLRAVAEIMALRSDWLVEGGAQALRELLGAARPLVAGSPPQGVMIAAGPNAERGVAASLAPRFIADASARVVFTGHLAQGTPAPGWVSGGQALFHRWNVHPTLSGLRRVLDHIRPDHVMAAFCTAPMQTALAAALDRPLVNEPKVTW